MEVQLPPWQSSYVVITDAGCLLYDPDAPTFETCPDARGRHCGRPGACPHGLVLLAPHRN